MDTFLNACAGCVSILMTILKWVKTLRKNGKSDYT